MLNQYCPKCGGVIVFIVAIDDTLCSPQCENGYEHLNSEQVEKFTEWANIEWVRYNKLLVMEWYDEMALLLEKILEKS